MQYIKLTLADNTYSKTLVNLNEVHFIRPHELNNFRNVKCTVISFGGGDNFIEVLEPVEEIERMISAAVRAMGGVNYHD